MRKTLLFILLTSLAVGLRAQKDTFYVYSVEFNDTLLAPRDWPSWCVVEDDVSVYFAQSEYKKAGFREESQKLFVCCDCCGDSSSKFVYDAECNGRVTELIIRKFKDGQDWCGRAYEVDGYFIRVMPYSFEDVDLSDEDEVFSYVQENPQFPGGLEALYNYLARNVKYPSSCDVTGKVYVQFVVEKDGSVTNACILRNICEDCGKEALRVVNSMPKWIPGKIRGIPVRCRFNLPVNFALH